MTTQQTLLEIATLAAGALGRHLAPKAAKTVKKIKKPAAPQPKPKPQPKVEYVRLYDAVTTGALGRLLSTSSDLIGAYDDGQYANVDAARKDYPGHKVVTISVDHTKPGDFLDVEPGCAWPPAEAKGWLEARRKAGARFIGIYGDASTWRQLLEVPGIDLRGVKKWLAEQNGVPHIPPGYDGCQYDGSALDSKLNYDVSLFKAGTFAEL